MRTQQRAHHRGLDGSLVFAISLRFFITANSLFQNVTSRDTQVWQGFRPRGYVSGKAGERVGKTLDWREGECSYRDARVVGAETL